MLTSVKRTSQGTGDRLKVGSQPEICPATVGWLGTKTPLWNLVPKDLGRDSLVWMPFRNSVYFVLPNQLRQTCCLSDVLKLQANDQLWFRLVVCLDPCFCWLWSTTHHHIRVSGDICPSLATTIGWTAIDPSGWSQGGCRYFQLWHMSSTLKRTHSRLYHYSYYCQPLLTTIGATIDHSHLVTIIQGFWFTPPWLEKYEITMYKLIKLWLTTIYNKHHLLLSSIQPYILSSSISLYTNHHL